MEENKLHIKKIVFSGLIIVQAIILLFVSTYGWLVNNWSPTLTETNIEIATSGGLVIGLTGEDGDDNYHTIELNKIVGVDSFVFKQVSSANGKDFFYLDYTPTLDKEPAVLRPVESAEKNGFIDADFCLITERNAASGKYVYLHHETQIIYSQTVTPLYNLPAAIRIAVTFKGTAAEGGQDTVYIFGENRENIEGEPDEVDRITYAALPNAENEPITGDMDYTAANYLAPQRVYSFKDFNGGRFNDEDENGEPPSPIISAKTLYPIGKGETRWVNVKVWLEGGSPYCDKYLSGQQFGLRLKFGSSNII